MSKSEASRQELFPLATFALLTLNTQMVFLGKFDTNPELHVAPGSNSLLLSGARMSYGVGCKTKLFCHKISLRKSPPLHFSIQNSKLFGTFQSSFVSFLQKVSGVNQGLAVTCSVISPHFGSFYNSIVFVPSLPGRVKL